jgi:hypothetical protein
MLSVVTKKCRKIKCEFIITSAYSMPQLNENRIESNQTRCCGSRALSRQYLLSRPICRRRRDELCRQIFKPPHVVDCIKHQRYRTRAEIQPSHCCKLFENTCHVLFQRGMIGIASDNSPKVLIQKQNTRSR